VLARTLAEHGIKRAPGAGPGRIMICTTDLPAQFSRLAERFLGGIVEAPRQVALE
jgi:hypothetical protein